MSDKKKKAEEVEETKAAPAVKAYDPDELIEYTAPLLPGSKQKDIWVAVNGETCVIKRGIPVQIKRKFLEALQNAQAQQYAAYRTMAQIQKQGEKPAAEM